MSTRPSIRRRAVRFTVRRARRGGSAAARSTATSATPEGWPIRTGLSLPAPGRATSAATVPGMRAAAASASAAVRGSARCGRPMEITRAERSTASTATSAPLRVIASAGGATKPILGTLSVSGAIPIAAAPARRIASSRSVRAGSASIASGSSTPLRPRASARTTTSAVDASISVASISPTPGTSSTSRARPVGSRRPVTAPPGSRKERWMGAPWPATPSSTASPSTTARPPATSKRASIL